MILYRRVWPIKIEGSQSCCQFASQLLVTAYLKWRSDSNNAIAVSAYCGGSHVSAEAHPSDSPQLTMNLNF